MTTLEQLCAKHGITAVCKYGGAPVRPDWPDAHPYKVTLARGRKTLTTRFYCGSGWTREPSAADVLSSLISDARCGEMSFQEFCSELGYDSDSRRAGGMHLACVRIAPRVRLFLGDLFETFADAEH